MKTKIRLFMLLFLIGTFTFAQTSWETTGNAVSEGDWLGTTNYEPLIFKTNNTQWAKFDPDGKLYFDGQAKFNNGIVSDSIRIVKYLVVDSIHCRTIKIGNSLTDNDVGPSYSGSFRPYDQQLLNASDGTLVFESGSLGSSTTDRDNPKFVIGYVSSANGVFHKLNLHSNTTTDVFSSFTNRGLYTNPDDLVALNGFKIGIKSSGVAEINQQENLDLNFLTNNNQRMVIKNAGNVGINTTSPANKLEITHGTSGNSGLRFTNLTNASSSITNTTDKILSVNSTGDVILVDDKQGSGGGSVNYCAGVSDDFLMKREASGNLCISGVYEVPTGSNINNIGIGTGANNSIRGKLNVVGNAKIGSTYAGNTIVAPADGALIEGNVGIGRTNANAQNTVDARLHINVSTGATRRNFFLGTARDRSISGLNEQAFRMFTEGTIGNEDAVYQAVGMGLGRFEAVNTNNTGVRLTSSVGGSNIAGIEPLNQAADRLAIGGDTIFPNTTILNTPGVGNTICQFKGPYLGDYTHHWGRVYTHDIMQNYNTNVNFFRIRPGSVRDVSKYDCAMYIQTGVTYSNAAYLRIIGPPTAVGADYCNNTGISTLVPEFEVGAHGVGIGGFMPIGVSGLWVSGDISTLTTFIPSDERIKKNVNPYEIGLDAIRQVNVKSYQYKPKLGITDTVDTRVGVIAQELMQVLPNAVDEFLGKLNNPADSSEADQTILRIDQNVLLFTAINAIKDLDNKNQELTQAVAQQAQKMEEILQRLDQCCTANHDGSRTGQLPSNESENNGESNSLKVELSNSNKIVLNQNEPNPFKEKTIIKYTIPTDVKQAEIIFFDKNGSIIKSVLIETRGAGQLEVYSSNLSAGTYTYSLVADGISIDTKNMINIK